MVAGFESSTAPPPPRRRSTATPAAAAAAAETTVGGCVLPRTSVGCETARTTASRRGLGTEVLDVEEG